MRYWLYNTDLYSYYQYNNKIGYKERDNEYAKRNFKEFCGISKNDKVVYTDRKNNIIIGLFTVTTDICKVAKNDTYWPEWHVYGTKLELPEQQIAGEYLNLRSFLSVHSDFESMLNSETCREINVEVYDEVRKAYSNFELYKIKISEATGTKSPTGWQVNPDLLAGLLDYYNSRAVSFASLSVALIFGLVTLTAIIQQYFHEVQVSTSLLPPIIISIILYLLFSFAGGYLLNCYSYYTGMADKVNSEGIIRAYFKDLKNITIKIDDSWTSLVDIIHKEQRRHSNSWPKSTLKEHSWLFKLLFGILIILLGLFSYWELIQQVIT